MNRRMFMASLAALVSTRLFGGRAEAATPVTLTNSAASWDTEQWPGQVVLIEGVHVRGMRPFSVTRETNESWRRFTDNKALVTLHLEHEYHPSDWKFDVRYVD